MSEPTHHTRDEERRGIYAADRKTQEPSRSGVHDRDVPAPPVAKVPTRPAGKGKGVWDDAA